MDRNQVKALLHLENFPPKHVLAEILEEEIFSLRDYFLRNRVVKVLFNSRIRKLEQFISIHEEYIVSLKEAGAFHQTSVLKEVTTILDLLKQNDIEIFSLKTALSKTLHPLELKQIALQMVATQEMYEKMYLQLFRTEFASDVKLEEHVKAADHLDSGTVLKWIQNNEWERATPLLEKEFRRITSLISK